MDNHKDNYKDIIITVRFDEMLEIVNTFLTKYKIHCGYRDRIINDICFDSISEQHIRPQQVLFDERTIVETLKKYKSSQ